MGLYTVYATFSEDIRDDKLILMESDVDPDEPFYQAVIELLLAEDSVKHEVGELEIGLVSGGTSEDFFRQVKTRTVFGHEDGMAVIEGATLYGQWIEGICDSSALEAWYRDHGHLLAAPRKEAMN